MGLSNTENSSFDGIGPDLHGTVGDSGHGNDRILFEILASRAEEYPRNATSDFKASADIANKKKYVDLQQFAAVLLPPPSSLFYPVSAFPRQYRGK
jgi:hypothetical protein